MYTLNSKEVEFLNAYSKINLDESELGITAIRYQIVLEILLKEFCRKKYGVEETRDISSTLKLMADDKNNYYSPKNFPTKSYRKNNYSLLIESVTIINYAGNNKKHTNIDPSVNKTKTSQEALEYCIRWYFKHGINIKLEEIQTNDEVAKKILGILFPKENQSKEIINYRAEIIPEREKHYILILIDQSQSMYWPYLKDKTNCTNYDSADSIQAIATVQDIMSKAHEKSLNALRSSLDCLKRRMEVFQYVFNHKNEILNLPKPLSPTEGDDEVKIINKQNYSPEGGTALYDTLEDALRKIYTNYLEKNKKEKYLIDKLTIAIITDGDDTIINGNISKYTHTGVNDVYVQKKKEKIVNIKHWMKLIKGNGDLSQNHLEGSVLIGLTSDDFSLKVLEEIKKEIGFEEAVAINQADEKSLRKAFKTVSTGAINV